MGASGGREHRITCGEQLQEIRLRTAWEQAFGYTGS
jgi:hypothetical protein